MLKGKSTKNNIKWLLIHKYIPQLERTLCMDETTQADMLEHCIEDDEKFMTYVNRIFTDTCLRCIAYLHVA